MSSVLAMLPKLPSVLTTRANPGNPDAGNSSINSSSSGGKKGYQQSSRDEEEEEDLLQSPSPRAAAQRRHALKKGLNLNWKRKPKTGADGKTPAEPESDDEEARPSDDEEELGPAADGGHGMQEDVAAENDIIASYYELDDVRIPPRRFHRLLKRFYAFFLAVGITINPLKRKTKKKLLSGRPEQAEDDKAMAEAGACPVPVDGGPRSWWVRVLSLKWLALGISLAALFVHAAVNVVCALHSSARVARCIFALFGVLSWVAAVLLAQDILSRRMIGTRLYYVLNNTIQKRRVTRLIKDLFQMQIVTMLVVSAFGIVSDILQWPEARQSFTWILHHHLVGLHATTREVVPGGKPIFHLAAVWEIPIWVLWIVSSIIVRLQMAAGVAVFSTIIGVHLLRLDSCLRALKRPGTSVHRASVQVFDIDVSLAELSFILDVRLSCLLVCSFLTFFFQSVYLTNKDKDDNIYNDTSFSDVIALSFPCMLCAWMLLGCSSINQACQRLTIVATRFAGFQERERLNAKYRAKLGDGDSGDTEGAKDNDKDGARNTDEKDDKDKKGKSKSKDAKQSKDAKCKDKSADDDDADDANSSKKPKKSASDDKKGESKGKKDDSSSSSDDKNSKGKKDSSSDDKSKSKDGKDEGAFAIRPETGEKDRSGDAASSSGKKTDNPYDRVDSEARLIAMEGAGFPSSDALERSNRDLDGDGDCDLDDDLELLKDRLDAFLTYLKNADIRLRLANIEIDTKVVWGFVLVSSSTLFSLLQIQHTNFL